MILPTVVCCSHFAFSQHKRTGVLACQPPSCFGRAHLCPPLAFALAHCHRLNFGHQCQALHDVRRRSNMALAPSLRHTALTVVGCVVFMALGGSSIGTSSKSSGFFWQWWQFRSVVGHGERIGYANKVKQKIMIFVVQSKD